MVAGDGTFFGSASLVDLIAQFTYLSFLYEVLFSSFQLTII